MKRLVYIVPIAAFLVLSGILLKQLISPNAPGQISTALIGKPVPDVVLTALRDTMPAFTPDDFKQGKITVLNIFASWCAPCRAEAPVLSAFARDPRIVSGQVQLFGMVYRDKPQTAEAFLAEMGNPFSKIAMADGRTGLDWGVYQVPETFVIDGRGIIRARIIGALSDDNKFQRELLPAIEAARDATL